MNFFRLFAAFTKFSFRLGLLEITAVLGILNNAELAHSQIIPDTTLPNNSSVLQKGNTSEINGGTAAGKNLFHSFSQFSIPKGQTAYFNNLGSITNIIGRITGNSQSAISGILKNNGIANLFLINPNGIIFSQGAALNIGGSFLSSTAFSLNFADRFRFSTKSSLDSTLSSSAPESLSLGQNPGSITLTEQGHNLSSGLLTPVLGAGLSRNGLRILPSKSIILIGGDISLAGGLVTAPNGRIEIGSVKNGEVQLTPSNGFFTTSFDNISEFGDINLSNKSLLDASGPLAGYIKVEASNITLRGGSVFLIQNQGPLNSGNINLVTTTSVNISGTDPTAKIIGGILTESLSAGGGGQINISTPTLNLAEGGSISTRTFTLGQAGDIFINTPNSTVVSGFSPVTPALISNITSFSGLKSSGNSGDVAINSGNLNVLNNGSIGSFTRANGNGGNVKINASGEVKIDGANSNSLGSNISTSTLGNGIAGGIDITASRLTITNGASIFDSTLGNGDGGSISIKASDQVMIQGNATNSSLIEASAVNGSPLLQMVYGLPEVPRGNAGSLTITTPKLFIANNAGIFARNKGYGNAGNLSFDTTLTSVSDNSNIAASTLFGNGGNIIAITTALVLENSQISASAGGQGQGGNISITAKVVAGNNYSSIFANAVQGNGGDIKIDTQGLIFNQSNITAASQKGAQFNGSIRINSNNVSFQPHPQITSNLLIIAPITCKRGAENPLRIVNATDLDLSNNQIETLAHKNNVPLFLDGSGKVMAYTEIQGVVPLGNGIGQTVSVIGNPSPSQPSLASKCQTL